MLFPLKTLLDGRDALVTIRGDVPVRQALAIMIERDFSQLPVVDASGHLTGIITEAALLRKYYHLDGYNTFLDLSVDHFRMRAATMSPDDDVFEALDRLKATEAIIVIEDRVPCGIITDYDTTLFFRNISEGLVLVQDIEVTLRQHIEAVYPDASVLNAALIQAVGASRDDPTQPKKEFEQFSFGNTIYFIIHDNVWPRFEAAFGPKDLFFKLMDAAREIRNQLAHFRGTIDRVQFDLLLNALQWLVTRPRPMPPGGAPAQTVEITEGDLSHRRSGGRYDALRNLLSHRVPIERAIQISFQQIEELLGAPLPASARQHRSWWSNDPANHAQALAWLEAGWEVEDVDTSQETVTFRHTSTARTRLFFTDLLHRIRAVRRDVASSRRIRPSSELVFSLGLAGFYVRNAFGREGLRVELYIDLEDYDRNKEIFDAIYSRHEEIERELNESLEWRRIDGRRACRVYALSSFSLDDSSEQLEQAKVWASQTSIAFVDTFRPLARTLTQGRSAPLAAENDGTASAIDHDEALDSQPAE